jgi:hypothetical protein
MTKIEFPSGEFGLICFGSILYYFNPGQVKEILEKAYQALCENGLLIIRTLIADEERCQSLAPLLGAVELLHDAKYSQVYTFPEYKQLIEAANFTDVTQPVENIIKAIKRNESALPNSMSS